MTSGERQSIFLTLHEDSYLRAFTYAALVSAITTGLVLEYRFRDPFGTYIDSVDSGNPLGPGVRLPHFVAVMQTSTVAFVVWMLVLVLLYVCFSLGDSMLAHP